MWTKGSKAWFGHIQLLFDGTSIHAGGASGRRGFLAHPIPPTNTRCQWTQCFPCTGEAELFHFMSTQLARLCSYSAEHLFGVGRAAAGITLPFGTDSAPRLFLQHSATDTEKHHTIPLSMRSGCLQGPDDYAHSAHWHRKRAGRRRERR